MPSPHPSQNKQAAGSHWNFNDCFGDWSRNGFAMLLQTFEVALDSITNIRHRFIASFPLRDAARQTWAFGDKHAIFVWFNRDTKFHVASLAIEGALRNANVSPTGYRRTFHAVDLSTRVATSEAAKQIRQ